MNGIGLVLAIVLAFALVACLSVCVFGIRRSPKILAPASPEQAVGQQASVATQHQLDEAVRQADQLRVRAESDAAAIMRQAETAAEQVAQGRREVEDEIRAVKDEIRQLRGDLERREQRIGEREQRLDDEGRRLEARGQGLEERRTELEEQARALAEADARAGKELERVAHLTADQAKAELV